MPFVILFFYMLAEFLAFWAVASLIGFGWALVALLATVFLGIVITRVELRRIAASQASLVQRLQNQRAGGLDDDVFNSDVLNGEDLQKMHAQQNRKSAGDIGLTLAGALLLSIPGFVTAIIGLLLVFPLTRPIIRGFLLGRMLRSMEKLGVRFFEASSAGRKTASYGSFGFSPGQAPTGKGSAGSRGAVIDSSDIDRSDIDNSDTGRSDTDSSDNSDSAFDKIDKFDEEELRKWAESMRPEDFTSEKNNSDEPDAKDDDSRHDGSY